MSMSLVAVLTSVVIAAAVPAAAQSALSDQWTGAFTRSGAAARLASPQDEEDRYPSAVRVITAAELERSPARTVQEALRGQPGVTLYDQVGNAFQPTVDLRGFNGSPIPATVVLIDGVRVNEADFGQVNFQAIPLEDVECIELMPGPQTLFGKNALGGVINVVTKRGARRPFAWAEAGAGSYGARRLSLGAGGPV